LSSPARAVERELEREADAKALTIDVPAAASLGHPPVPRGMLTFAGVMALQRLVGNAAVSNLLDTREQRAPPLADAAPAPVGPTTPEAPASGGAAPTPETSVSRAGPAAAGGEIAPAGGPAPAAGVAQVAASEPALGAGPTPGGVAPPPGPATETPAVPDAPPPVAADGEVAVDPHAHPGFQVVKARAAKVAGGVKAHAPPAAGAAAAQAAAQGPSNEVASQGAEAQLDTMGQQQPGVFDKAAFVAAVKKAVDAAAPKNLEEADDFKKSGKAARVKDEVGGIVRGGKQQSEKDIKGATEAPPDTSKAKPKPVTSMAPDRPGAPPPPVGAEAAMPPPRPAAETDLSAGPASIDAQMTEAKVTDDQLKKGNEPGFEGALKSRDDAREHAATAPAVVRTQEQAILEKSKGEAAAVAAAQTGAMHGSKVQALAKAMGAKTAAKGADEARRAAVASDVQRIYERTKTDVTAILTGLDGKVDAAFTAGEKAARDRFETYVATEMGAYKDKRYSGFGGGALWLSDKLFSLPDEVNVFYERGRAGYLAEMDQVIDGVAVIVGAELGQARKRIADGRAEVSKYVRGLDPDLRQVGKEAEQKLEGQFDQLASDVDAKQSELVDTLAQKYVASRDAVDARIAEMKEANKGLVDKAKDAISGVIKTILQLKDMLLGVLAKAGDVIGAIIDDPIGFFGKLADGVKAGLARFVGNIATHLQNGLMNWLFGALGSAGITMPKSLDFAGILDLVMQVLGLTYNAIRARVVNIVGAPIVDKMEQTVDVFKTLATEGVAGIWRWIQDKLSSLEDTVLGQIKNFIIEKVIKSGITWILSLLNPAAAFIKACKAIYDFVMFIIERGSQIMEFVNSILDSIGAIAKGAIGIVAEKVESSLAKALPLAISMLASLLNLGGISEKIKSIIQMVKGPIDKAVDWLITGAVKGFKKLFGPAIAWAKGKYEKGKAYVKDKYEKGKASITKRVRGGDDSLEGKQKRLVLAMSDARKAFARVSNRPVGAPILRAILNVIRGRRGLSVLEPVKRGDRWAIHAVINPEMTEDTDALVDEEAHDFTPELESQWDQIVATLHAGKEEPRERAKTKLSSDSAEKSLTTLHEFAAASGRPPSETGPALAIADQKVAAALAAEDGDAIYRLLGEAQAAINALFPKPKPLQVHHQEQVKEHPATFPETRLERLKSKMSKRIASKYKVPGTIEARIAQMADRPQQLMAIRRWAEEQLAEEIKTGSMPLPEVNMWIISALRHLGIMHGREAREYYESHRAKEAELVRSR
jgi:hypothetical protein